MAKFIIFPEVDEELTAIADGIEVYLVFHCERDLERLFEE